MIIGKITGISFHSQNEYFNSCNISFPCNLHFFFVCLFNRLSKINKTFPSQTTVFFVKLNLLLMSSEMYTTNPRERNSNS